MGKPSISANKAAAEVRHKILRKMAELDKSGNYSLSGSFNWEALRNYIKQMADRASNKKGGLGKR